MHGRGDWELRISHLPERGFGNERFDNQSSVCLATVIVTPSPRPGLLHQIGGGLWVAAGVRRIAEEETHGSVGKAVRLPR